MGKPRCTLQVGDASFFPNSDIEHTAQWDQYYDETQQLSFWHNLKEGIYTWYDPFAEFYQEEAAGYDEHDQSGYY